MQGFGTSWSHTKEEAYEEAPGLDHPGGDTADWSIQGDESKAKCLHCVHTVCALRAYCAHEG